MSFVGRALAISMMVLAAPAANVAAQSPVLTSSSYQLVRDPGLNDWHKQTLRSTHFALLPGTGNEAPVPSSPSSDQISTGSSGPASSTTRMNRSPTTVDPPSKPPPAPTKPLEPTTTDEAKIDAPSRQAHIENQVAIEIPESTTFAAQDPQETREELRERKSDTALKMLHEAGVDPCETSWLERFSADIRVFASDDENAHRPCHDDMHYSIVGVSVFALMCAIVALLGVWHERGTKKSAWKSTPLYRQRKVAR